MKTPEFIIVTAISVDDRDTTTRIAIRASAIEKVVEVPILNHTQLAFDNGEAMNVMENFDDVLASLLGSAD